MTTQAPSAPARPDLRRTLTRVAWWSILLGLGTEALLVLIRLSNLPQLQIVSEGLGKITWSVIVCVGLGIGKLLSESKPFWMGLAGIVGAPVAFTAAQAVQRTVSEITTSIAAAPVSSTLIAIGALRGVEYLCLGAALSIIAQRKGKPWVFLAAGLVAGVVFGLILLALTPATATSLAGLLGWGVNELLFPMGCSAVLYGAGVISQAVQPRT